MLEFDDALAQILAALPPTISETVPLNEANRRVLAESVRSPIDLPGFDNSAMDGFAVRSVDVQSARPDAPISLQVAGRVPAGEQFAARLSRGSCIRLFTGSPIPAGADAVLMQEDTRPDPTTGDRILALDAVKAGENIRLRGEDIKEGEVLAAGGEAISVAQLALLAATGVSAVEVGRRPMVGLLATGNELQEPGQRLEAGQIYESNRLALAEMVRQAGGVPRVYPLVKDELAATKAALELGLGQCDVLVSSGGVSVGELDFVKQAFEEDGGRLDFWKVAMKPGRPFVFGRRGQKMLFGLPGNPISALVTFLVLVRPALLRWQGASRLAMPSHRGVLGESLSNEGPRRHFVRVRLDAEGRVYSAGIQASHILSSMAAADGLVDVPARSRLPAGSSVEVMRLWS